MSIIKNFYSRSFLVVGSQKECVSLIEGALVHTQIAAGRRGVASTAVSHSRRGAIVFTDLREVFAVPMKGFHPGFPGDVDCHLRITCWYVFSRSYERVVLDHVHGWFVYP